MGSKHVLRGRVAPAIIIVAVILAVVAIAGMVGAAKAQALPTFNQAQLGIGPCDSCHTAVDRTSRRRTHHAGIACSTCHTNGGTANSAADDGVRQLPRRRDRHPGQAHAHVAGLRNDRS